jgi:hypothetical protein
VNPMRFDRLVQSLGRAASRRDAVIGFLAALFATTVADGEVASRRRDNGNGGKGKGKDKNKNKGKNRKKRGQGGSRGQASPPTTSGCCGTKTCADPARGATRSGCNFSGRDFLGADLHGAILRGIDGRGARFTAADLRGAVLAGGCFQGASFRRARLAGATWGGACLVDANLTGADLGNGPAGFADALLCGTVLPDGTVSDRDCARETACCQQSTPGAEPSPEPQPGPPPGPEVACQKAGDCPGQPCQTKACVNGQCVYTPIADGPDPAKLCGAGSSGHCCAGTCCGIGATECNPLWLCCAPNCGGKQCGPDGCGAGGTCGSCPSGVACEDDGRCACTPSCVGKDCGDDGCGGSCGRCDAGQRCQNGRCVCDAQSCPDGCCDANGACQPGTAEGACGRGGATCAACPPGQDCLGQQCGTCPTLTCPELGFGCGSQSNRCGGTLQCGRCPLGATPSCQDGTCRACADVCPGSCGVCVQLLDGTTRCGANIDIDCDTPCSSNAGCASDPGYPTCAVTSVGRGSGEVSILPELCQRPRADGMCVAIAPCCTPDCAGKTCGPDVCNGSCGACGPCQICENGTCRQLRPNGVACDQDGECCSDNCFGGVCSDLATECPNSGPCDPPAKGCVAGFCCSCASPNDCCAGQCCGSDQFCCGQSTCCFNAQVCDGGACSG